MSNPGVCTLVEFQLNNQRFCIEDNIGEAIHIHYGHFRIDLTVKEFLALAEDMMQTLKEMIVIDGLNLDEVDPLFLFEISRYLPELQCVKKEKVKLAELQVDTLLMGTLPMIRNIKHSRIIAALKQNTRENDMHSQENLLFQDNSQRLESIKRIIESKGYPYDGRYIILFNNQRVIRDGQHRAGCLYFDCPDRQIDVQRFIFKDEMYNVAMYPYLQTLFVWSPRRLRKVMRKAKDLYKYEKIFGIKRTLYSITAVRCVLEALKEKL